MKDFSDFRAFMTSEKKDLLTLKANEAAQKVRDSMSPDDAGYESDQLLMMGFALTLSLLEEYHNWLAENQ